VLKDRGGLSRNGRRLWLRGGRLWLRGGRLWVLKDRGGL